jgi:hypothetical protein
MAAIPPNSGFDASVPLNQHVGGIKASGALFVGRYIASSPTAQGKVITPTEAVEFAIAGIPLFVVHENGEKQSGAGTGQTDGNYASAYLPTIGLKPNTGVVVYYAEDFDVSQGDMAGISAAFQAFGMALSGYDIGVYSCGFCNAQLLTSGLITKRWLSASTSYNGTHAAIVAGAYDMFQGLPMDVMINNRSVNVDADALHIAGADIGARVPWGGAIPQNAPLGVAAIQMLLNKAGQTPPLATDDSSGPLTKAAIIASKQRYGVVPADTSIDWANWVPHLCADAGVRILPPGPTA